MYRDHYDVCIFGAGPAGCVAARKLCDLGYSVLLAERYEVPKFNHYLSLSQGCIRWLKNLELYDAIVNESKVCWLSTLQHWHQEDFLDKKNTDPNLFIYRSVLHEQFQEAARLKGANFFRPLTNYKLHPTEEGNWRIALENQNNSIAFTAAFVIEASGMNSIIRGSKKMIMPKMLAISAVFRSIEQNTNPMIEAGPDFWIWASPVSEHLYSASFFTDPAVYKKYFNPSSFIYYARNNSTLF